MPTYDAEYGGRIGDQFQVGSLPRFLESAEEKQEDSQRREQDVFGFRPFHNATDGSLRYILRADGPSRDILRDEDEEVYSLVSYLYQWLDRYAMEFESGNMSMKQAKKALKEIIKLATPPPLSYDQNVKRRRNASRSSAQSPQPPQPPQQPQLPPPGEGFIQRLAPFQNNIFVAEILPHLAGIASWGEFEEDFIKRSQALVNKNAALKGVLSRMFSYVTEILKIYQVKEFHYRFSPPTPLREEDGSYYF